MRVGVDQVADLADVAEGDEPAAVDQHDLPREGLDLVEHVARDQDRPARPAELEDQVDQLAAGDRVGAGEGLVEEEHPGVMDQRLGQLGPLPHPLRVSADGPVGVLGHADLLEDPLRGGPRAPTAQAGERAAGGQELAPGHPLEEGVLLGAESDQPVQPGVVPGPVPEHPHLALAGPELAGRQLQERALARAVGPEQARDAGRQPERQVVHADHVAIPLGDAAKLDGRWVLGLRGHRVAIVLMRCQHRVHLTPSASRDSTAGGPASGRGSRGSRPRAPTSPASTPADHCHG